MILPRRRKPKLQIEHTGGIHRRMEDTQNNNGGNMDGKVFEGTKQLRGNGAKWPGNARGMIIPYYSPCTFSSHCSVVIDALAQVFISGVVGESPEFVLNSFGEVRIFDDRVLCHFIREFRVEVGNI